MGQEQEIIEGLGSAIINYTGDIIYVTGFYSIDRLMDWEKGIDCWQSKAIFNDPNIVFDYTRIEDDALFIIKKEDHELERYLFKPYFKGTVKYKNTEKKDISRKITLRKSLFSKHYHIVYQENNIRQCIVCNDMNDVEANLNKLFPRYKIYDINNKRIPGGLDAIKQIAINLNENSQLELF